MDMRHRSDTPQELGGTGHLGVRGIWGCWESGGVGHLGVLGHLVGLRHRPRCLGPAHMPDAEAE